MQQSSSEISKRFSLGLLRMLVTYFVALQSISCSTHRSDLNKPLLEPGRAKGTIVIDGRFSDSEWKNAQKISDFRIMRTSSLPSNKTIGFITYDSKHIYVTIKAYADHPGKGSYNVFPKDDQQNASSDWVGFCLDSYNDGLSAEFFMSNPVGGQVDGHLNEDGSPSMSFSAKWKCVGAVNDDHYIVEMAIPFQELPFVWNKDYVDMAFRLVRFDAQHREESDFPQFISQNESHLSQFQKIRFRSIAQTDLRKEGNRLNELSQFKLSQSKLFDLQSMDGRSQAWGEVSVIDYKIFKYRELMKSSVPFLIPKKIDEQYVAGNFLNLSYKPISDFEDFDFFLERTQTTAFIVIKNDATIFEKYYNARSRDSLATSFSVAKSFVSVLLGMAIDDGFIKSEEDAVTKYLPELIQKDKRYENITIRNLISMSSGLRYDEGDGYRDHVVTYYHPDLRIAALEETEILGEPDAQFLYNNYNPILVGMVLERAVGKSVTTYMQDKIWTPLGMEYTGSWSLDEHAFEKMESGLNARPIDFAKLGLLMQNGGMWDGKRLLSKNWTDKSTQPQNDNISDAAGGPFFERGGYYGWFWWGLKRKEGASDFFALGNKGQYIYVSPQKKIVIVRNGIEYGIPPMMWVRMFYDFASTAN